MFLEHSTVMCYRNSPSDNLDGYSVTNRQVTLNKGWFTSWPSCARLHHISQNSVQSKTKVKWKSLSHVTFCNPMNYMVHGILQARILEWVAFPFSRESSQPRDQTQVSCIAGRFFTSWATRKALIDCLFLELSSYILDPADWGKTTSVWMGKWNSKFKWFRDLY